MPKKSCWARDTQCLIGIIALISLSFSREKGYPLLTGKMAYPACPSFTSNSPKAEGQVTRCDKRQDWHDIHQKQTQNTSNSHHQDYHILIGNPGIPY